MPATTIQDNGASLKVTIGSQVRNILKAQIAEIAVIRTNIIRIDLGHGALNNIFITHSDVTAPVAATPAALRDALNAMLNPTLSTSTSTEARQVEQINILTAVQGYLQTLQNLVTALDSKVFLQPLAVDDSGVGIVYKGYAVAGTNQAASLWAIEKIEKIGEVEIHTWADGDKLLNNRWADRETLVYS